jgi:hypothetical protein
MTRDGPSAWGQQLLIVKNKIVMNILKKPQTWMGSMDKQPE